MSHLSQCLSSGASGDISCRRKHTVYFNLKFQTAEDEKMLSFNNSDI